MLYRELFNLTIRHDFYQDRKCPDFTLSPTPECEQLLRNYKLVVKASPHGVRVLAPVRLDESGGGNPVEVPFVDIPANARFDFWLRLDNPEFSTFTGLYPSYGNKKLDRPVFSNENLAGAGTLEAKEMQASRTEYLKVPEDLLRGQPDFVVLLKDKPFRDTADLHIFLDPADRSGKKVVENWQAWTGSQGNNPRGFSIETMGAAPNSAGSDPLSPLPEYVPLARPFKLEVGGANGVLVSYHGPGRTPEVKLELLTTPNHEFAPTGAQKARFNVLPEQPRLIIYTKEAGLNGGNLSTWNQVLANWSGFSNRQGFRLSGAGSTQVPNTSVIQRLVIQGNREAILPTDKDNGIKITYTGSQKTARVKVSLKANASDPPFAIEDQNSPPALQGQPAGVRIEQFYPAANAARVAFSESDKGQSFQLHYPVRPALPWGVFGKVEVHNKPGFTDFATANADKNLIIRFIPLESYWAYYIVTEVALGNSEVSLVTANNKISFSPGNGGATATDVAFKQVPLDTSNTASPPLAWATFRANPNLPAGIPDADLEQIHNKLLELEKTLGTDGKLHAKRFLYISESKIPCRERYRGSLSLKVDNSDLDTDETTFGVQAHEIDSLPLPMAGGNEIKIVRITSPEIVKAPTSS